MASMIDTLQFANDFEKAGFEQQKAHALASAFAQAGNIGREDSASKSDLKVLESSIKEAIAQLDARNESRLRQFAGIIVVLAPILGTALTELIRHFHG